MIEKAQKINGGRGINVNRKLKPDTGRGRRARGVVCCAELIAEDEAWKKNLPGCGFGSLGVSSSRKEREDRVDEEPCSGLLVLRCACNGLGARRDARHTQHGEELQLGSCRVMNPWLSLSREEVARSASLIGE